MTTSTADGGGETMGAISIAAQIEPLLEALLGAPLPVHVEFWDGSRVGSPTATGVVRIHEPAALRRIAWAPGELGLARAFVAGEITADGDLIEMLTAIEEAASTPMSARRVAPAAITAVRRLGVVGRPPAPPSVEYEPTGWRAHTRRRDAASISHHYDVSNEFYAMVLGPSMTYSCARFPDGVTDLADAQASKHEHICRKLGLDTTPGARLLDVGCGWGSMAIHAATRHGARVVGITISEQQAALARRRADEHGVGDLVEIRLQDYRDIAGETFDAISSVGMSEHVGSSQIDTYFEQLHALLRPQGRLLNHAISSVGGSRMGRNSFIHRYVFPDGELLDVADTVRSMEAVGLQVRDVESLREHYALTLRAWVANLRANWDRAVAEVGVERARVWLLYMSASVSRFELGAIDVHQVLGVAPDERGRSGMPRTRPV